jgi:hypothetical protein
MVIGIDPTVDFAFKKLQGSRDHPALTISFINAVLGGTPLITGVEILNPFLDKGFEDDKLTILDVKARDDTVAGSISRCKQRFRENFPAVWPIMWRHSMSSR